MIRELIQRLIGGYSRQNQTSANGNRLPPGYSIITEEIVTHGGTRYLAMQISPPWDDESKRPADYIKVGIIVEDRVTDKRGGGTGTFRRIKIIDVEKVGGLAELVRGIGLTGDIKYDGEESYELET